MIHMKNLFYFAASAVLLAFFGGCATTSATKPASATAAPLKDQCLQDGISVSPWICKPQVADAYSSVGVAQISGADKAQTTKAAIHNGRVELTKQIQSQVREKLNNFARTPEGSNKEKVDTLYTAITNNIKPEELHIEQTMSSCIMPSGKVYVHVIAPKSSFDAEIKRAVKSSFKNDRLQWLGFNSKQAVANLEKEFDVVIEMEKSVKVARLFREEIVSGMIVGANKKR
ncbi:MAG TPA: hypothetical protein CFH84_03980 [Sulfurimonas sp. UBA12504]|nr:MAG: hypothetical protein A2019_00950 [Sulfurimonas sp. GWF2_37_8]DAB30456.1 MAG TPA: hypothetical protein CFH84_03980 [Sulfurimonas sp. UBA12504]